MLNKTKTLAAALFLALAPMAACSQETERGNARWATTENTNVAIDWDKINEAYKLAEGPEDFEKRVNDIYKGDEVVSVAVHDVDAKVQEVTGFFDKNQSGSIDEGEKIFTIKREITGEGQAQMQTQGHGAYMGYHSPLLSIATGMLLGSMMSRAFMPGYMPMYSQPYTTGPDRASQLRSTRSERASSQARRASQERARSSSGRAPRPSRGGGRFGVQRSARRTRPVLLTA